MLPASSAASSRSGFFTVYGPRQRPDLAIRKFASRMIRGQAIPVFGDGTTERDYPWIDDILDGVVAAIHHTAAHPGEFEIINLGGNRTTALSGLIQLIADALDVHARIERLAHAARGREAHLRRRGEGWTVAGLRPLHAHRGGDPPIHGVAEGAPGRLVAPDGCMNQYDLDDMLDEWEDRGFDLLTVIDGKKHWKDLCVVYSGHGPSYPCDWIEYDPAENTV